MEKKLTLKQTLLNLCKTIKHLHSNKIQDSNTEIKNISVCPEDDSVSEVKAMARRRRVKVVVTRKELDRLLAKQVSLEQIVLVNQRTVLRSFDDNKWKPGLESIYETIEL